MSQFPYDQLPPAGQRLARIPRFGIVIARIARLRPDRYRLWTSNAAVYWDLLTLVVAGNRTAKKDTGLLDSGFLATEAQQLGWQDPSSPLGENDRTDRIRRWQIRLALRMLGAIAFQMMCGDKGDGTTPPLDRIVTPDEDDPEVASLNVELFEDRVF